MVQFAKGKFMEVLSATEARKNFFKLPQQVNFGHEIYVKMKNQPDMVIISADDWRNIQETLHLHSIPNMISSIRQEAKTPLEDCKKFEVLSW